ncbi:hypothetical protein [Mesorhizobium japonicum]|uniref:hypothetical protein n=1 Tax=Mesorhizobium japonicum TaxID=2066070 RepID=UPI0005C7F27C|nr:hypothetical protein [Mesorhizobium japonicum]
MKRLLYSIFAALFVTSALAHVPPTAPAYAKDLFSRFDELLRQRQIEGRLPRLDDPRDRETLQKIWNGDALIGSPPYDMSDLDTLALVMDKSGSLVRLYGQATQSPLVNEATQSMALAIRVAGASQPAFDDFLAHQPNVAEMLRANGAKARRGIEKMFRGASIFLADPTLTDENEITLVESLRSGGPYLAQSVSTDRRQALVDMFVPLAAKLPPTAQESLKVFMQEIKTADCNRLCADSM